MKPIHKLNNGRGATLCHKCTVIITTGLTKDLYCERCKPKQETLEEFCNRELENFNGSDTRSTEFDLGFRTGTIIGLRFPKERSYSKEDMIEFAKFMLLENHEYKSYTDIFKEWFEQIKKK